MKEVKIVLFLNLCTLVSCVQQNRSEVNDDKDTTCLKTEYRYEDKDKVKYPIYLSKSGRAYVVKQNNEKKCKVYLLEKYRRKACENFE